MSNPKISVIIPVYNVEDYLEDTLNGLLKQTFIDEMEVLMIDDGSSDNSGCIIERFDSSHDNFHAFHKENEGAALTRNFGIDRAKGDYIHFFDGDDYLTDDWYEKLFNMAVENDCDIITSPIIRFRRYNTFEGTFYKHSFKNIPYNIPQTRFEDVSELIWDLFITNKLYKREFVNRNNLRMFEENRYYCDDTPFSLRAYLLADKVSISRDVLYYWRLRSDENLSSTQKITQVKNFKDRLYAVNLYNETFDEFDVSEEFLHSFYVKILDYDLYVHFSKFHMYDSAYYGEIVKEAKELLKRISEECRNELDSFKQIIYQMVEDEAIDDLYDFSKLDGDLKENPQIPPNLNKKYADMIDFERDAISQELKVKRGNASLGDENLIIEFKEHINYLNDDYPHEIHAKLIEDDNEYSLDVEGDKIIIPLDLIREKHHMNIRAAYVCDSFRKENYLSNSKREVIRLDDYDIELGIEPNGVLSLDIRQTNDLVIEIDDVAFKDDAFEFRATSDEEISKVYIQNVSTFEKITYPVKHSQNGFAFSIPYDDIKSYPIRKWELKVENTFKTLKLTRKFEFFTEKNRVYIINARNKVMLSDDFYDSLDLLHDYSDKIADLKDSKKDLKNEIKQLKKELKQAKKENKSLKNKNAKLKEKNSELENRMVNFSTVKSRLFKK